MNSKLQLNGISILNITASVGKRAIIGRYCRLQEGNRNRKKKIITGFKGVHWMN